MRRRETCAFVPPFAPGTPQSTENPLAEGWMQVEDGKPLTIDVTVDVQHPVPPQGWPHGSTTLVERARTPLHTIEPEGGACGTSEIVLTMPVLVPQLFVTSGANTAPASSAVTTQTILLAVAPAIGTLFRVH
jgi:hypothetical protein